MSRLSHHSTSKVGRRRSQLALKKTPVVACEKCGGPSLAHKSCPQCGSYAKKPKKKAAK